MKTWVILATLLVVATAVPQGGFFSNLASRIRNSLRRPSRQTRQPPPPFRPRLPAQPAFPPQGHPTLQKQQQPHEHAHNHPQSHQQQHQQKPFATSPFSNQISHSPLRSQPGRPQSPPQISSFTHGCAHAVPNLERPDGSKYIMTFLNGCSNFTAQEADDYCRANAGRAISLDTTDKANYINNILAQNAQRYLWTGGRIDHNAGVVTWPSGAREGYQRGKRFWSYTGGASKTEDVPQPDNRDGNEVCIAILNNFYADGIRWHDVACHHRKPTICQLS
ncbi:uncharacterized protein [Lepeophtheirus salmonis]|uniref:E-selectin n=2 Tax=Lepeophtheirus salmonis TaxID=72036 RepID=C1BRW3_LEPSM|nr:uncharacterized protein LOC121125450 [Lepeophtheirus salmonis]ACO11766.1 E-selectin precursor [Lepeophtheirus salmonis]